MKLIALLFPLFCGLSSLNSQSTNKWFNPESISSTVLLEVERSGTFIPHGTGFLVYPYKSKKNIIVTCEHVLRNSSIIVTLEVNEKFRGYIRSLSSSLQRQMIAELGRENIFWNIDENFFRIRVNLIRDSTLFLHPNGLDIAAFKLDIPGEVKLKDSIFHMVDLKLIGRTRINNRQNISIGDDAYFIGFPFGIGSPQQTPSNLYYSSSTPRHLLRKATIAWVSNDYDEFLLDALSFGGNSGSPVFQVSYEPNKPPSYLIGMVTGHLGDSTGNFGLARCYSIDELNKVILLADK